MKLRCVLAVACMVAAIPSAWGQAAAGFAFPRLSPTAVMAALDGAAAGDTVFGLCGVGDRDRLETWVKSASPALADGLSLVCAPATGSLARRTLLWLSQQPGVQLDPGDAILAALAYNYALQFELLAPELHTAVKADLVERWRFYQELNAAVPPDRKSMALSGSSLLAKLWWSAQISLPVDPANAGKLGEAFYRNYIVTTPLLRRIAARLKQEALLGDSMSRNIARIEQWASAKLRYHWLSVPPLDQLPADERALFAAKEDTAFDGIRQLSYFENSGVPYQFGLLEAKGFYSGFCAMQTGTVNACLQAAGIASCGFLYHTIEASSGTDLLAEGHTFTFYYHPGFKTWMTYQVPPLSDRAGKFARAYFFRPLPAASWIWNSWVQEDLSFQRLHDAAAVGLDDAELQRTLFPVGDAGGRAGRFARLGGAPDETPDPDFLNPRDSDRDGLPDALEIRAGLDPRSWDSDRDGLSDRWETDCGYDPLKAASPGGRVLALDGFAADIVSQAASNAVDPAGDQKAGTASSDITGLSAVAREGWLYVGVSYAAISDAVQHELWITGATDDWWVATGGDGSWTKLYRRSLDWGPADATGIQAACLRDVEYRIPLSLFAKERKLSLLATVMAGQPGKEIRGSDESPRIEIELP